MRAFQIVVSGLFGLLFGSFLNVCIYRIPRDLSVVVPRSFCPECGSPIGWYDNVPIVSFALLRGRCRDCGQRIAWRYPAVELITALAFAAVAWRYGWTLPGLKWVIFEALAIALFWTDLEERILPDEFTLGGSVAGLLLALVVPLPAGLLDWILPRAGVFHSALVALVCAAVFSLPFWLLGRLYERFRQVEAFGLGDVKLLALLGVFLGWEGGVRAVLTGLIGGAVFGVLYALITRQSVRTTSLPLGTFLCLAAAVEPFLTGA